MKTKSKKKITRTIWPYVYAIPEILVYEVVSKAILAALAFLIKQIMMWAVLRTGRVAVSSGDWGFLFKSPFGWIAIITAVLLCMVYIAFDINIIVNYCGEKAKGRRAVIWKIIPESMKESLFFFTPQGLLVLLYTVLLAPLFGIGMGISLTDNLKVPNFISSVIESNIFYNSLYLLFCAVMIAVGFFGMFTIHGMIVDNIPAIRSFKRSFGIVRKNFWDIIKQIVLFFLKYSLITLLLLLTVSLIPLGLMAFGSSVDFGARRIGVIALVLTFVVFLAGAVFLAAPLFILKLTQMYYKYSAGVPYSLRRENFSSVKKMVIAVISMYALMWLVTFEVNHDFNYFFPSDVSVAVIGHRGSGNDGGENTLAGIRKAIELNCFGTEIDIQRTADGYYVLNHDKTFKRVAGVNKAPGEMTLKEIKELTIKAEPGEKVPTIEEVLDTADNKITLFIELKGASADIKMCEDMVALIKERNMLDTCVLISLKYDLIDFIETNYPEINTGYLAFISLGKTADLNCDYLGLEEEAATFSVIESAHENGRKVLVWTPNSPDSQRHFILSDADGIITDNASQASELFKELEARDDLSRMIDWIIYAE